MTASERILAKSLVGSNLNSAQWATVQAGLRDRAFFSATVENVRVLHSWRSSLADYAAGRTSLSDVRMQMRDALAAVGHRRVEDGAGTVRDVLTQRRLDLIVKTNTEQARGWVQYMEGTSPGALAAYPAQRLVRVENRKVPRDWSARWRMAGDAVGWQGASREEMVALKTSPIWAKLSRFGNPFPPYDFNSGMGLEDVGKRRTLELGLATREELGEIVHKADERQQGKTDKGAVPGFNTELQATVEGASGEEAEILRERFGDQIAISGDTVSWRGNVLSDLGAGSVRLPSAEGLVEVGAAAFADIPANLVDLIPSLLREPGFSLEVLSGGKLVAKVADGILKAVSYVH